MSKADEALTELVMEYCDAVQKRYACADTRNIKKANAGYFLQWVLTGDMPCDNPGWWERIYWRPRRDRKAA